MEYILFFVADKQTDAALFILIKIYEEYHAYQSAVRATPGLNLATSGDGHVLKGKGNTGCKGAVHTLCYQKCCNSLKAQNINIEYISTSSS
jgi:hypothetical protein